MAKQKFLKRQEIGTIIGTSYVQPVLQWNQERPYPISETRGFLFQGGKKLALHFERHNGIQCPTTTLKVLDRKTKREKLFLTFSLNKCTTLERCRTQVLLHKSDICNTPSLRKVQNMWTSKGWYSLFYTLAKENWKLAAKKKVRKHCRTVRHKPFFICAKLFSTVKIDNKACSRWNIKNVFREYWLTAIWERSTLE